MKNDLPYIRHILDAADRIEHYLENVDFKTFTANDMMAAAVIRELEIIGEATRNISETFRLEHPEIPWRDMMTMRNFLIHVYFGVSLKIVWTTCREDVPALKKSLTPLVNEQEE